MSEYSSLKVFHHQDKLQQLREGKQIIPAQVQIFISDLCNENCSFCAFRNPDYFTSQLFPIEVGGRKNYNPMRMIPYRKILEILDDCKEMGVKALQYSGGGEPTVHPEVVSIFDYTLEKGLDLALVSNGILLHKLLGQLVYAKWVRVSIDAGKAETYAKMRSVSIQVYDRVWENIEKLVNAKESKGSKDLVIGIGFVITKENWSEVLSCAQKAKKSGLNNIRISGVFQSEDEKYFEPFYGQAVELCRAAKELETASFRVFNMFGDRVQDLREHSPDYSFCGYQQFNTLIGGDQNVYRCCTTAYNPRGLIGSIKEQRFKDLWLSQAKQDDFDEFDAKGCPRCMFNSKNRTIVYALEKNPIHVNFI